MRNGLPILLDLSRRTIVIIGGGAVAARKAAALLAAGAQRIVVVAPQVHESMPPEVQRVSDSYSDKYLQDADIVIAATDVAEMNARVVHDARRRRILVGRVDDAEAADELRGDFVAMAAHRAGPVTIAVAAGSAALSAAVRDGIASRVDPRWPRMAEAMRALRPRIRDELQLSPARRRALFRDLTCDEALTAANAGPEQVWQWLVSKHPDLARR
jgi:siroheme synthase-like protein